MFDAVRLCFFCFKQKTAYEMRISDWSSDVCSSDLLLATRSQPAGDRRKAPRLHARSAPCLTRAAAGAGMKARTALFAGSVAFAVLATIGRASCRERVCQYV